MGILRRLRRPARCRAPASRNATRDQRGNGSISFPAPAPQASVIHPLDLDIGEVAPGYHLIARSVSLWPDALLFEYEFRPELTDDARGEVWLNMFYSADVPPPTWNYVGAEGDVQYDRPPPEARYAWFDFFRPDYEWMEHVHPNGQPDSDYLRNRVARLTVDLKTGEAKIEK